MATRSAFATKATTAGKNPLCVAPTPKNRSSSSVCSERPCAYACAHTRARCTNEHAWRSPLFIAVVYRYPPTTPSCRCFFFGVHLFLRRALVLFQRILRHASLQKLAPNVRNILSMIARCHCALNEHEGALKRYEVALHIPAQIQLVSDDMVRGNLDPCPPPLPPK